MPPHLTPGSATPKAHNTSFIFHLSPFLWPAKNHVWYSPHSVWRRKKNEFLNYPLLAKEKLPKKKKTPGGE